MFSLPSNPFFGVETRNVVRGHVIARMADDPIYIYIYIYISVFGDFKNSIEYMNKLMNDSSGEKPLEYILIFYCGGSNAIKKSLKDISKRYDIDLALLSNVSIEFEWIRTILVQVVFVSCQTRTSDLRLL